MQPFERIGSGDLNLLVRSARDEVVGLYGRIQIRDPFFLNRSYFAE